MRRKLKFVKSTRLELFDTVRKLKHKKNRSKILKRSLSNYFCSPNARRKWQSSYYTRVVGRVHRRLKRSLSNYFCSPNAWRKWQFFYIPTNKKLNKKTKNNNYDRTNLFLSLLDWYSARAKRVFSKKPRREEKEDFLSFNLYDKKWTKLKKKGTRRKSYKHFFHLKRFFRNFFFHALKRKRTKYYYFRRRYEIDYEELYIIFLRSNSVKRWFRNQIYLRRFWQYRYKTFTHNRMQNFLITFKKKTQRLLKFIYSYEMVLFRYIMWWGVLPRLLTNENMAKLVVEQGCIFVNFKPQFNAKYNIKADDCIFLLNFADYKVSRFYSPIDIESVVRFYSYDKLNWGWTKFNPGHKTRPFAILGDDRFRRRQRKFYRNKNYLRIFFEQQLLIKLNSFKNLSNFFSSKRERGDVIYPNWERKRVKAERRIRFANYIFFSNAGLWKTLAISRNFYFIETSLKFKIIVNLHVHNWFFLTFFIRRPAMRYLNFFLVNRMLTSSYW